MKIKQGLESEYEKYKSKNTDPYGQGIVTFTERWVGLMEGKINSGSNLPDIAAACSSEADTEGITGFMYGCAVSSLAYFWEHGEELRQWHNKDTQIGEEGDRANESGGVLNPALIIIG